MSLKTYENIHKELVNCITGDDTLTQISKYFKELKTDSERVAECFQLLRNYNLLPDINIAKNKKSADISEKYRNDGNRAFVQKDDMLALYYYNRSVTFAPIGGKEMSLAFANRSATTFSLGDYTDTIKDIDRALGGEYPDHLKHKLWERKGKCLMKLSNYKEAEIALKNSIKYLCQSNLSDKKLDILQEHLNSLLAECSSHTTIEYSHNPGFLPNLSHGANPYIQSGSAAIDVEHSYDMGRYLVATKDINPGDVLAIEKPYSSITLPNSYLFHCFHCHKRCHSMLPCLECTLICYCDETCRTKSWEESHNVECNILKPLLKLGCGKLELLALRVLINATKSGKILSTLVTSIPELESFEDPRRKGFSGQVYLSDCYKSIHNLEGNTDLRNVTYLFGRSVVTCCMLHILDLSTDFFKREFVDIDFDSIQMFIELEKKTGLQWDKIFAGGLLLKYLQSMASNAHEISEMRIMPASDECRIASSEIGSAAYALLSLINHSCDPNVVRHSYCGSDVVLTAIQFIKKGDQIFDNYGFHHATHNREERHSHLKSQYHFTCQCIACAENWPLYVNLPDKNPAYLPGANISMINESSKKFREILYKIIQDHSTENVGEWLDFLYSYIKLLQESIKRPWKEYSECQEAMKQCLSFQANHHIYKTCPQSLMSLTDRDTGVSPF